MLQQSTIVKDGQVHHVEEIVLPAAVGPAASAAIHGANFAPFAHFDAQSPLGDIGNPTIPDLGIEGSRYFPLMDTKPMEFPSAGLSIGAMEYTPKAPIPEPENPLLTSQFYINPTLKVTGGTLAGMFRDANHVIMITAASILQMPGNFQSTLKIMASALENVQLLIIRNDDSTPTRCILRGMLPSSEFNVMSIGVPLTTAPDLTNAVLAVGEMVSLRRTSPAVVLTTDPRLSGMFIGARVPQPSLRTCL